ncbi:MAG: hypothetical protein GY950_37340 [bacterium]|nr:hypothetical protein [bacterium]
MRKIVLLTFLLLFGLNFMLCAKVPRSGVGVRASVFGIPNRILDYFIYQHPEVKGESYAFEIRSYGSKGPKSVFSGVYSLEYSKMRGEGPWQDEQGHRTLTGKGEVTQFSATATIIMSLFPSSPVHPYIGGGLGVGKIDIWYEGTYTDELGTQVSDEYREDRIIPVVHVPVGIVINLKNRAEIRIEGGFKNGFYVGAGVVLNF